MFSYNDFIKAKMLSDMMSKMDDGDKQMFAMLLQDIQARHGESMALMKSIESKVDRNKYSFSTDLLANVTGNVITDATILLGKWLFGKI